MAFTIPNGVTDVIKALSNFPNRIDRLKATQLKAIFDQAAKNVQADVKRLVSELGASTAAGNIGFAPTVGVSKTNVQDAIENVQSQIAGVSQGAVANGSITSEKLADGAVTAEKIAERAISFIDISDSIEITAQLWTNAITRCEYQTHSAQYAPALGMVFFEIEILVASDGVANVYLDVKSNDYKFDLGLPSCAHAAARATTLSNNAEGVPNALFVPVGNVKNTYCEIITHVSGAINSQIVISGWYFTEPAKTGTA